MSSEQVPFSDCPLPNTDTRQILLGHGSGGKLTADLIEKIILPAFSNAILELVSTGKATGTKGKPISPAWVMETLTAEQKG